MICKQCKTKMEIGTAIDPKHDINTRYLVPRPPINQDTLELIDVWKCNTCGRSEKKDVKHG